MENKDIIKFVNHCKANLDFTIKAPKGYPSAPICALDAIFSLGVRYKAVENVINKFCKAFNINWETSDKKTSDLLKEIEEKKKDLTNEQFAKKYLNLNKTSSTNGILKASAFVEALNIMKKYKIETCEDIKNKADENFESAYKSIKGQKYGTSLHYFYMLCGNDNLVKVDRHIKRFSCQALEKNELNVGDIQILFKKADDILKEEYPDMTPRRLDYIVWRYMRNQNNKKENKPKPTESQRRNKNNVVNKASNTSDIILPHKNRNDRPIKWEWVTLNGENFLLFVAERPGKYHFCQLCYEFEDDPIKRKDFNINSMSEVQNIIHSYTEKKWYPRQPNARRTYKYVKFEGDNAESEALAFYNEVLSFIKQDTNQ